MTTNKGKGMGRWLIPSVVWESLFVVWDSLRGTDGLPDAQPNGGVGVLRVEELFAYVCG